MSIPIAQPTYLLTDHEVEEIEFLDGRVADTERQINALQVQLDQHRMDRARIVVQAADRLTSDRDLMRAYVEHNLRGNDVIERVQAMHPNIHGLDAWFYSEDSNSSWPLIPRIEMRTERPDPNDTDSLAAALIDFVDRFSLGAPVVDANVTSTVYRALAQFDGRHAATLTPCAASDERLMLLFTADGSKADLIDVGRYGPEPVSSGTLASVLRRALSESANQFDAGWGPA